MYVKATDCKFLTNLDNLPFIEGVEYSKDSTRGLIQISFKNKKYFLGIDPGGFFHGFRDSVYPNKLSDLLICKTGLFSYSIFERRFTSGAEIERILFKIEDEQKGYVDLKQPAEPFLDPLAAQQSVEYGQALNPQSLGFRPPSFTDKNSLYESGLSNAPL